MQIAHRVGAAGEKALKFEPPAYFNSYLSAAATINHVFQKAYNNAGEFQGSGPVRICSAAKGTFHG